MPNFVNTYTFIPLQKRSILTPLADSDAYSESSRVEEAPKEDILYTGVIKCQLTTRTKVIIPGPSDNPEFLPFFKVNQGGNELPVIPGSSIRGMVRSVFESMTNSCIRYSKNHDQHLASVSGAKRPGLLFRQGDNYVLWSAERFKVWEEGDVGCYKTGDCVDFTWKNPSELNGSFHDKTKVANTFYNVDGNDGTPENRGFIIDDLEVQPNPARLRGVFLRVYPLKNGRSHARPSIFVGKEMIDEHVNVTYVNCLEENIQQYLEHKGDGPYQTWYMKCFEQMKEGNQVLPVWFGCQRIGEQRCYQFSWACLSRSVYNRSLRDFYRSKDLDACPTKGRVCPACELFGYVSEDSAKAGRVRFGDATICADSWKTKGHFETLWLPVLANPHSSSFEFYLQNTRSPHVFTPEFPETELRGRKVYWHRDGAESIAAGPIESEGDKQLLNCRAECIPSGLTFSFEVYIDAVTKKQLHWLLYALTYGEYLGLESNNTKSKQCFHRIGRGKPYGYGSVHLSIREHDAVCIRDVKDGTYVLDSSTETWRRMLREEVEADLVNLGAIKNVASAWQMNTSYPKLPNDENIYAWFSANRKRYGAPTSLPVYNKILGQAEQSEQAISMSLPTDRDFCDDYVDMANQSAPEVPNYGAILLDDELSERGHEGLEINEPNDNHEGVNNSFGASIGSLSPELAKFLKKLRREGK